MIGYIRNIFKGAERCRRVLKGAEWRKVQKGATTLCTMFFALCAMPSAFAYELPAGNKSESVIGIDVRDINRSDDGLINVSLDIDLSQVKMKSDVETVYTPMFVNGTDTVRMKPFAVVGRNRLYWDRRNDYMLPVTFYKKKVVKVDAKDSRHLSDAETGANTGYTLRTINENQGRYEMDLSTRYVDWMETATFTIDVDNRGCANCIKNIEGVEPYYALAQNDFVTRSYFPEFLYVTPVAEAVKMREISARAYIDFPVNQITIYPDYRRNPEELAKIRATIDSVRNDKDINITALHISGTASPEGGYQNNVRLASGRTAALKDYVQGLYRFPQGFITTSYEPVDWKGLADFLEMVMNGATPKAGEENDSIRIDQFQNIPLPVVDGRQVPYSEVLPNAGNILAIVDSDMEPVARNNKIKTTYPSQYAWLLENVYPALRHSDYRISFEIKTFTEVSEILDVMQTQPQKLSLAELFVAANSQPEGSELYNRAFELAVTMYPEDETANLNAATAAMQRGDLISAQRYLSKLSESPESDYANAMYTLMSGDVEAATEMFRSLANSLNPAVAAKAKAAVAGLDDMAKINSRTFIKM